MHWGRITAQGAPKPCAEQVGSPRIPTGSARFASPNLHKQKPLGALSEGPVGHALPGCLGGGRSWCCICLRGGGGLCQFPQCPRVGAPGSGLRASPFLYF